MKRTLSATIIICILLSVVSLPVAALAETSWAMGYVDFCVNQGLFRDKTRTSITETQKIKRQEVAYALMKIQGANWSIYDEPMFSDVAEASYYNGAINWAYSNGIMNGTGNGQFNPSGYITKQDLAVTIYRYLLKFSVNQTIFIGYPDLEQYNYFGSEEYIIDREKHLSRYHDAASISSYARDAVYELSLIELITGSDTNYFSPLSEATLVEAACMFTKAHGYRYNNTDSINVYVRAYTGSSFNNVAVTYLRYDSSTSYSTNDMQIKITSNGIANLTYDGNGALDNHYVNAMSQYTSTFLPTPCEPSPFYQFITIPRNEADYELTTAYDRYNMYQHNYPRQCVEPSWAFPQWCPTQLIHSGQNFGWRYNGGVKFHQGMDYTCSYETIYNTTGKNLIVIASLYDGSFGYYVKVRVKDTDDYLLFAHLSSNNGLTRDDVIYPGDIIGVTGNTGSSTGPHLHLQLVRGNDSLDYTTDPNLRHYFYDPRIYFE